MQAQKPVLVPPGDNWKGKAYVSCAKGSSVTFTMRLQFRDPFGSYAGEWRNGVSNTYTVTAPEAPVNVYRYTSPVFYWPLSDCNDDYYNLRTRVVLSNGAAENGPMECY